MICAAPPRLVGLAADPGQADATGEPHIGKAAIDSAAYRLPEAPDLFANIQEPCFSLQGAGGPSARHQGVKDQPWTLTKRGLVSSGVRNFADHGEATCAVRRVRHSSAPQLFPPRRSVHSALTWTEATHSRDACCVYTDNSTIVVDHLDGGTDYAQPAPVSV